eukprot:431105-Ditylum_brightwellii.AAC.1
MAKSKHGNQEELINWQIRFDQIFQNKVCKFPEIQFDMVEILFGDNPLQYWRQFKSQSTSLPILGKGNGRGSVRQCFGTNQYHS